MKLFKNSIICFYLLILFLAFIPLLINDLHAQTVKNYNIDELSISIPDEGWTLKPNQRNKWELTLIKEKTAILKITGYSILKIKKDSLQSEGLIHTIDEISDSILNSEYNAMKKDERKGNYEILDTNSSIKIISEKKFYSYYYKIRLNKKPVFIGENILYLFFPADFSTRHVYYRFMENEYVEDKSLFATNELDVITPVLKSIKIELK